jgi:hypothetical protein
MFPESHLDVSGGASGDKVLVFGIRAHRHRGMLGFRRDRVQKILGFRRFEGFGGLEFRRLRVLVFQRLTVSEV